MDRARLERWLADGLSLEEMGRRTGRHPSTVSYWLDKHGLRAAHRLRHAPRGSLTCEQLDALVRRDLSVRQIADEVGRSPSTVRYWLQRYGLETSEPARRRRVAPRARPRIPGRCEIHGEVTLFVRDDGSTGCPACTARNVTEWRRQAKRRLVAEAGGRCRLCGYDRCIAALQFHHVDPEEKRFAIGGRGLARSMFALREEAAKCVLLCANCHIEVENGAASLPATMSHSALRSPGSRNGPG